jgi:hypothetical protein
MKVACPYMGMQQQKVATSRRGEIMMSYCVSKTEQTTAKSYLFVLNKKKKTPKLDS